MMKMKSHRYAAPVHQAVVRAQNLAVARRSSHVETAHLFLGLLEVENEQPSPVTALLEVSGVTRDEAQLYALSAIQTDGQLKGGEPPLSTAAQRVLALALEEADRTRCLHVGNEHLFIACVRHQRGQHVGQVLRPLGLDAVQLRAHLMGIMAQKRPDPSASPLLFLADSGQEAVEAAHAAMRDSFCGRISTAHLLLGVLADEGNVAVETLRKLNIDVEALKKEVRSVITTDGEIATPQLKFTPAAKRALERAKKEVDCGRKSYIGPQHLLYALLPRSVSIQEKVAFGSDVIDPLEGVWAHWPAYNIEQRYIEMWRRSHQHEPGDSSKGSIPESWIRVRLGWLVLGALWWPCAVLFNLPEALPLVLILSSLLVAVVASIAKNRVLRDAATSVFMGVMAVVVLTSLAFMFWAS